MVAPALLWRGNLPTSEAVVYTAPPAGSAIVTNIVCSNGGSTAASVRVALGDTVLLPDVGIPPAGLLTLDIRQVLTAGESITVLGNAAAASCHISGVEVT